MPKISCIYL